MKVPRLETDRLILRGHRLNDFEDSASMWADPDVVKFILDDPSSREASWGRLLRYGGLWSLLEFGYWAVEAKSDGRFIGEVGFAEFKRNLYPSLDGVPEAGWVLRSNEFGQGYATEAVTSIHHWADVNPKFNKTVCLIDPANHASIHVAHKTGYQEDTKATHGSEPARVMWRTAQDSPTAGIQNMRSM